MKDYEKALDASAKVNAALGQAKALLSVVETAESSNAYIDNTTALAIAYLRQSIVELEDSRIHLDILCDNLEPEKS